MPVAPGKRENIEKALLNLKMDMPSLVDEKAAAFKDYRVRLTRGCICWTLRGKS